MPKKFRNISRKSKISAKLLIHPFTKCIFERAPHIQENSGLEIEAADTVEDSEDAANADDDYFDRIVGEIEDVIIDERFLQLQSGKQGPYSVLRRSKEI
jgi:hypothetical protein